MSIDKLPLRILGLKNIPAIPIQVKELLSSLVGLGLRTEQTKQSTYGLSNVYTIGGITAPAYPFLFGASKNTSEDTSEADASSASTTSSATGEETDEDTTSKSGLSRLAAGAKGLLQEGKDLLEDGIDTIHDLFDDEATDAEEETSSFRADLGAEARAKFKSMLKERSEDSIQKFIEDKTSKREPQPLVEPETSGTTDLAFTASEAAELTKLSLDDPEQFSMSWTNFGNVYRDALPHLESWARTLTDAEEATRQFWPLIARHGLAYNLLILKKLGTSDLDAIRTTFGDSWNTAMERALEQGNLYAIDLSIFETLEPQEADGAVRFTPATVTLLRQDPSTKTLAPIAIRVTGNQGQGAQIYVRGQASDGAWLYALQAAKVSVTVYGIWLGHVYHWHIVTAAMQMTMYNTFSEDHPIYQLLSPVSNYLIDFDIILAVLWEAIAPPASVTSAYQFFELCNTFAKGRTYFDDDPPTAIAKLGLREEDFTIDKPWDQYPIVADLLELWNSTATYAKAFVDATYADDAAVAADSALQQWIKDSSDKRGGNIQGLPTVDTRAALTRVLTSQLNRTTAHGNSRLQPAANPALTFVANFPPCLQTSTIPDPDADIGTWGLLQALPKTGVIGKMVTFYFTFLYSVPYVGFIPLDGIEENLFFDGGMSDPRNQALVTFREEIIALMTRLENGSPQVNQWPLNIEL